ncbi:MAG: carboxypeptidase regulatory-like domain-containing protein [Gemmatimonadaceae bacterium]|nr:carboxypeptidase regulatory-like domain-containing protein [Gemmatimonadaceae bacterium]MCW5825556.1 carboxypeptidase regulatory-like domain-containing protein [Gemmatimonadaceae bacterium]
MPIRRLLILSILALSGCNAIYGEPNRVDWPEPPSNYPTTLVRGRVFDLATNQPVAGATVTVQSASVSATTDADGNYNLDGIQAWAALFIVSRDGYDPLSVQLALSGGDQLRNFWIRKAEQ